MAPDSEPKVLASASMHGMSLRLLGDPLATAKQNELLMVLNEGMQRDWRSLVLNKGPSGRWRRLRRPRHNACTASTNLSSYHSIRFDAEEGVHPTIVQVRALRDEFAAELIKYSTSHSTC